MAKQTYDSDRVSIMVDGKEIPAAPAGSGIESITVGQMEDTAPQFDNARDDWLRIPEDGARFIGEYPGSQPTSWMELELDSLRARLASTEAKLDKMSAALETLTGLDNERLQRALRELLRRSGGQ